MGKLFAAGLVYAVLQVSLRVADEIRLAQRLKARDPQVMSALYDRFGKLVYSVIYRVVRDTAAAEDLVQETFLRVWNRAQAFDEQRGALGPWILAVARNRAIDHVRSAEGRMNVTALELDKFENPALFSQLEDTALSIDRGRRLKDAMEKLTPQQRIVIEMAYYEGLSQTEMAERMRQPLGTVKTWVRTALRILRSELAEVAAV